MRPDELQQFAYMKEKYQEMVKHVDQLTSQLKTAQDKYAELSAKIDRSAEDQSFKLNESYKKLVLLQEKYNTASSENERKIQSDLEQIRQSLRSSQSSFQDGLTEVKRENNECKAALQTYAPLASFTALKNSFQDLANKEDEHKNHIDKLFKSDHERASEIKALRLEIQKTIDSVSELSSKIDSSKVAIDRLLLSTKSLDLACSSHSQEFAKVYAHISDQINAIPKPVIPSLDDFKKQLSLQLEPAALDAKNANLRSSNAELKITLLEKRVERINLLLSQQS